MTDSIAERCIAEVVRRMGLITIAGGYNLDIGPAGVYRALTNVDEDALPCIVVTGTGEAYGPVTRDSFTTALTISIDGVVRADQDTTGVLIEQIKADIKQALNIGPARGLEDSTGTLGASALVGCALAKREPGSTVEALNISLTVTYKEGHGNPYGEQSPLTTE